MVTSGLVIGPEISMTGQTGSSETISKPWERSEDAVVESGEASGASRPPPVRRGDGELQGRLGDAVELVVHAGEVREGGARGG